MWLNFDGFGPRMSIPTLLVVLAVFAPAFVLTLLASFQLFDGLLRLQVREAREEWEAFGRPSGYFWKAPDALPISMKLRGNLWSFWLSGLRPGRNLHPRAAASTVASKFSEC
jgi:hypothetical protein